MSSVRAVAYFRMSTDKQETSIPDQRREVLIYAARNGLEIVREYQDEGISGDETERRVEFQKMVRDARERGDFQAIVCWNQARFGRFDPLEAGYWIKPLRDRGVWLETVKEGRIDWNTFHGRIVYAVQQEGKHAYLRDLSADSIRGMLSGARRGDWLGGPPPYGYKVVERPEAPVGKNGRRPKMLVPADPRHVEVVRWLFRTYAEKDVSLRWLQEELANRGVPSPRGHERWTAQTIRELLTRREYTGDYDWGQEYHGGYHCIEKGEVTEQPRKTGKRVHRDAADVVLVQQTHEPLIDRETWSAVQTKLVSNRQRTTPKLARGDWLLSGLLTCGHCGRPMYGYTNVTFARKGMPFRRYRCAGHLHQGSSVCHFHWIDEEPLVACVVRKIQEDMLNPDNLRKLREEARRQLEQDRPSPAQAKRLRARLTALEEKVRRGERNLALCDPEDIPGVSKNLHEWREDRKRLRQELALLDGEAERESIDQELRETEAQLWRLRQALLSEDPAEVRAMLRELLVKIEMWWKCGTNPKYRKCTFARGIIHVRADEHLCRVVNGATPHETGQQIGFTADDLAASA